MKKVKLSEVIGDLMCCHFEQLLKMRGNPDANKVAFTFHDVEKSFHQAMYYIAMDYFVDTKEDK